MNLRLKCLANCEIWFSGMLKEFSQAALIAVRVRE